jgi:cation diffusion facilitator family transporter
MDKKKQAKEVAVIWVSTILTVIIAAGNVTVALVCDSMTILLDGLYGMVDTVVSLLMIFVIRKLHAPANDRYHFGYAKFEPLMVFLEGVMYATICASAIVMGVQDLIHLESIRNINVAVLYSLVAGVVSLGLGVYMKSAARECSSPLLDANAELSIAEGLISMSVCAAFTVAQIVPRTSFFSRTEYTDPLLCIIVALVLLRKPLGIIWESFRDLLDASVSGEKQRELLHLMHRCKEKYRLHDIGMLKVRKAGRRLFLTVSYAADHAKMLRELDTIREGIAAEIVKVHPGADICIMFHSKPPAAGARKHANRDRRAGEKGEQDARGI